MEQYITGTEAHQPVKYRHIRELKHGTFKYVGSNNINTENTIKKTKKKKHKSSNIFSFQTLVIACEAPADPPDDDSSITVSVFSRAGLGHASVIAAHRERNIMKLFSVNMQDL